MHASAETILIWQAEYPRLHWIIPLLGNWTYSLFYVFSELWGTIGLSILFWQLANEITGLQQSKRFYPLFGMIGNIGILCSGYLLYSITDKYSHLDPIERWDISLNYIITTLIISKFIIIYIYRWIQLNIIPDPILYQPKEKTRVKQREKLSFYESMKIVWSSKYIACIFMMVISYGVCINLIEVTWKSQMKLQFPDTAEYVKMMGLFSMTTGITTIVFMIMGSQILRKFGWFVGAVMTPLMLLVTGSGFFGFIIFGEMMSPFLTILGVTPLLMAVIIGWLQNILTKGVKYSLFDPTKDMSYMPLPPEMGRLGKAVVDGIGGRLGK